MNKYIVVTLVMIVLLVALAEIYFALSWDEHFERGRWNITFNWTLKSLPEDTANRPSFFYSTQTSTKTILNPTTFNFSKTVNLSELSMDHLPSILEGAFDPNQVDFHEVWREPIPTDYSQTDFGFHPTE